MAEMNSSMFAVNTRGRDFIVGDLHGQTAMIDALLAAVDFVPANDRVFSLGDLIDRGPGSAELLARFAGGSGYFAIRGNHEAMLISSDRSLLDFQSWQRNGGSWAVSLSLRSRLELGETAKSLPLTITLQLADGRRIGLVHAEVPPGKTWADARAATMTSEDLWDTEANTVAASLVWGRRRFLALNSWNDAVDVESLTLSRRKLITAALQPVEGVDMVVCGHSIVASHRPEMWGNALFLDTGSYEPAGRLTLFEPLTGWYWQCRHDGRSVKLTAKPTKIAWDATRPAPVWPANA